MFRKLLVPLDRSSLAEEATGQAAAIARASCAAIDLVSVYEPVVLDAMMDEPLHVAEWDAMRRYLETVAAELESGAGVWVTYGLRKGNPVERICHHAHEVGADLIVLTSHGRTGLSRAWLGSVADGLIRHAHMPVLVLRAIESPTGRKAAHSLFKHVLVPLDDSPESEEVLPTAATLAKCSGARVSLLRVIQPVPPMAAVAGLPLGYIPPTLVDQSATSALVEEATDQLAAAAKEVRDEYGIDVDAHVIVEGAVARAILDFAQTRGADLIAMSTHGRGVSRLLLGSVADKVLRGCGLPLLAYRPDSARAIVEPAKSVMEASPLGAPA